MVDFEQLRDARPEFWQRAADGWKTEAAHAAHCADIIRARGAGPVTQAWIDSVGRNAAQKLYSLGDAFESAATEMQGAVMVLDGLAESVGIALSMLHGALDDAARSGLVVDSTGRVFRPPEALATRGTKRWSHGCSERSTRRCAKPPRLTTSQHARWPACRVVRP